MPSRENCYLVWLNEVPKGGLRDLKYDKQPNSTFCNGGPAVTGFAFPVAGLWKS